MSKVPKWKIEKAKVKVVFRLQFHGTHIPQAGWDKLFVSFISGDTGKPTAKTNKTNVRNGNCKWSDPIYEATRLIQDSRTKKYDEKLYKLVVAMGSSRSSILGEADINLADFAEAEKPYTVALPLHGCDSGTLLHVTVQLLTTKTGFREFEQTRELSVKSPQRISKQRSDDLSDLGAPSSGSVGDEVNAKDKLKESSPELHSVEDRDGSTAGVDGLSCTSDRSYGEKNDIYTTHDITSFKSTISGNVGGFPLSPSPRPEKEDRHSIRLSTQGSNDWTHGWSSDYSADNDLAMAHEENNRLRVRLEVAESTFLQLKSESKSLQCITDELGEETQGLTQQLAVELASGEQLTTEVCQLKIECLALKNDLEKLKSMKLLQQVPDRESSHIVNRDNSIDDLQINWLQALQCIESKIQEIQYEASLGFHETGVDSLLADFEVLRRIIENVKELHNTDQSTHQNGPLNKNVDSASMMQEKMCELLEKLEGSKTEKEILVKKINHMNCYYEAFIHELEESQKQTRVELESLRNEHSSCQNTVSVLQAQMEKAHQDMNGHMASFAMDKKILESQNKELEKRAAASETALRRVRRNYSVAVDRLQKDLELLSFQVLSMYESNETLAKQALVDAYHCCPKEHLEETHLCCHTHDRNEYKPDVKQTQQESRGVKTDFQLSPVHNGNICQLEATEDEKLNSQSKAYINDSRNNLLQEAAGHSNIQMENTLLSVDPKGTETKEVLGTVTILTHKDDSQSLHNDEGNITDANNVNEMKMSLHSLKDLCSTLEAELLDMHVVNIQWKVFSDILVQMVHDENDGTKIMKQRLIELERQLHDSTEVRESLMLKLHNALNQAKILRENEAKYISECDNLMVSNHILAAKLEDISSETALLTEKLAEYEKLIMECRIYETKYKDCTEERNKLENLLIQESLHKSRLESEIGSMIRDFNALKEESNRLQELITYLHGGLSDLCARMTSCSKQIDASAFNDASLQQELESMNYGAIISNLKKFQEAACQKIFQLHQEKEEVEEMQAAFKSSLKKAESDMFDMRQKLESEMEAMTTRLDLSGKLIEKFEQELVDVTEKYKISTESEEKLARTNGELTSRLALLEAELEHLTSESRSLMGCANEELKRTKVNLMNCQQENTSLKESIHFKNEATILLENELSNLKDALRFTHEDLQTEKQLRENFECANTNLSAQLEEKQQLLLALSKENTELSQKHEESQSKLLDDNLSLHVQLSNNKRQLELVLEDLLVTENEVSYMRSPVQELLLKHMEADSLLRVHMSNEEAVHDKNLRIETAHQSLKSEFEEVNGKKIDTKSQDASIEDKNYEKLSYENEIVQLKGTLISLEELVDSLTLSTVESDITSMILRSKSDEQNTIILMLKESEHELINLREQHRDLSSKLSEQIMKIEEYKNLSIHLRELKEKSDAEHHQACKKRENEESPFAMQESLRIAFIKEQYESKIHELKNQLSVSKKYAEEMLVKLQNAHDEVENSKRNEISLAKRIEEVSMKLSDTETELHQVLSDRRELVTAYDSIKTELECTMLSFDCCKEEKLGLESSFQECNDERRKVKVELDLVKRLLQNMVLTENNQSHGTHGSRAPLVTPIGQLLKDGSSADMLQEVSNMMGISSGKDGDSASCTNLSNNVDEDNLLKTSLINSCGEGESQNAQNELGIETLSEDGPVGDITIRKHFKEQERFKIGMKLFQKELQRLKAQNLSSLPVEVDQNNSSLHGLERVLSQLEVANEHLGTLFPSFKNLSGCGNALERVLALELELAEVLQAKKKSDTRFQSLFLKQHNDEAAVFQSFQDINELIQDMLELKRRHVAVESELKEMHGRYSQLSLQFAEVEGERQQLMMTLKNRTPKKSLQDLQSVWRNRPWSFNKDIIVMQRYDSSTPLES